MADKLVTPWECPGEDCNSSALTATDMVNVFGHYFTAAKPNVFIFFETCGVCNDGVDVGCVDCKESAERHEEAEIKFGEDYADDERTVQKGKKTGLRCRECLKKFIAKDNKKKPAPARKKPVAAKKKNAKKGAKREQPTPSASSDSGDEDGGSSGEAADSKSKSPKKKAQPPPSPQKKTPTKKTPRKTVAKKK
jgi:hypothetical protein